MNVRLAAQSYGKSSVLLTKVTRHADRHDLVELSVDIVLEGDFSESYLVGDNRRVVATDTMKNTVYALAADHPLHDPESFAIVLARHFVDRNEHVTAATVAAAQTSWHRIETSGGPHRHAFTEGSPGRRTCRVRQSRDELQVQAGVTGLPLLKTTDSAFRDFARDEFTTLADTNDRIFATLLNAEWTYDSATVNWNAAYEAIHVAMIGVFAEHKSLAVQQSLFAMGRAALETCPAVESIHLSMPNQHRIPVNLEPLGRTNRNEIFAITHEPFGLISATVDREER